MKILIKFGDNDFMSTFRGIGKILLNGYLNNSKSFEKLTKEHLVVIVNELSLGVYLSHQNYFSYGFSNGNYEAHNKSKKEYLTREVSDILLNEEVDEYLKENNWDNCETLIVDFNIPPYGLVDELEVQLTIF